MKKLQHNNFPQTGATSNYDKVKHGAPRGLASIPHHSVNVSSAWSKLPCWYAPHQFLHSQSN